MAGSSDTWRAVIPQLAKKYRVIAPDLLGHGNSDKPRTDYSLGAFAVLLRDLLDALDIPSATLVGHSLGGGIALQLVYQHPEYCRRLVLFNSGGLGADVSLPLRVISAPGAEMLLSVISSRPALYFGWTLWPKITTRSMEPERAQERREKYSALSDPQVRQAFLRTLRSVVDIRGQS